MAQEPINIRLSTGLKKRITLEKVESGDYSSISDYVREIIISDLAETRLNDTLKESVADVLQSDEMQEILSDLVAKEIKKRLT
jgi:Arc/MetJ-type ribon-helix-helix transcriptional regulator